MLQRAAAMLTQSHRCWLDAALLTGSIKLFNEHCYGPGEPPVAWLLISELASL